MKALRESLIPRIEIHRDEVNICLQDFISGRSLRFEHRLVLDDDKECNLTYMVTEGGEFRAWKYAPVPRRVVHSTAWQRSPALASFVHNATMSAAELSFASRLSLLPQLMSTRDQLSDAELKDLEKKFKNAASARENAGKAYRNALLAESAAALWVFLAVRGSGGGSAYKEGVALILAYLNAKDKQRSLDMADEAYKELERRLGIAKGVAGSSSGSSSDSSSGGGGSSSSSSGGGSSSGSSGGIPEHEPHKDDDCKLYEDSQSTTLICHDDMPNPEADPDHSPAGPRSYSAMSRLFQDHFYPNPDETGPTGPRTFGWSLVASGRVVGDLVEPFQINLVVASDGHSPSHK